MAAAYELLVTGCGFMFGEPIESHAKQATSGSVGALAGMPVNHAQDSLGQSRPNLSGQRRHRGHSAEVGDHLPRDVGYGVEQFAGAGLLGPVLLQFLEQLDSPLRCLAQQFCEFGAAGERVHAGVESEDEGRGVRAGLRAP